MEEWKRGEDTPTTRAATELFEVAYTQHPYGRPIIGYRATIEALNRERVVHFYQRWYHPNNMTVVIVGDIDREKARQEVRRLFDQTPSVQLPVRPRPSEPAQTELRLSVVDMTSRSSTSIWAFPPAG